MGVCLLPEHSMCANQGLLIGQSDQSAVEGDCLVVSFQGEKGPKYVLDSHIQKILNI